MTPPDATAAARPEGFDTSGLAAAIEALRAEVAAVCERLAALEAAAAPAVPADALAPATPEPQEAAIPDEVVSVLAAAVAAYLGKKAPIRQIRLVGSAVWVQQGRIGIQGSHR